ncbi:hypothetical protein TNCV_4468361 [Trichonephila clavipes]|nr:hypothetical protein TNCV_4468361 [Trichonephila clavipes]
MPAQLPRIAPFILFDARTSSTTRVNYKNEDDSSGWDELLCRISLHIFYVVSDSTTGSVSNSTLRPGTTRATFRSRE